MSDEVHLDGLQEALELLHTAEPKSYPLGAGHV